LYYFFFIWGIPSGAGYPFPKMAFTLFVQVAIVLHFYPYAVFGVLRLVCSVSVVSSFGIIYKFFVQIKKRKKNKVAVALQNIKGR